MNPYGLSEEQVLKNFFRKISQQDFDEIKAELKMIREDLGKLSILKSGSDLLTMDELCKELKLSRPSVVKLIKEKKKIKPIQLLDQDFRFLRSDVDDLLKNSYKEL